MTDCPKWVDQGRDDPQFRLAVRSAYQQVAAGAARLIIDSDHICLWHRMMFRVFVPLDYYAGSYRQQNPRLPCLAVDVEVGNIRGTPYAAVPQATELMLAAVRSTITSLELHWSAMTPTDRSKRVAVLLGFLIGRFIQIHPFIDGNGRTSRLIWAWGLLRFGVGIQAMIGSRPSPPYPQLMQAAMVGNFAPLIVHIAQHLAQNPPRQI